MKLLIAAVAVAGLAGCAAYVPYDAGYPASPYGAPAPYGYAYSPYGYGYGYAPPYPAPYYSGPSLFLGATVVSGPRFHSSHPRFGGLQGHVGGRWGSSGGRTGGWSGRRH